MKIHELVVGYMVKVEIKGLVDNQNLKFEGRIVEFKNELVQVQPDNWTLDLAKRWSHLVDIAGCIAVHPDYIKEVI